MKSFSKNETVLTPEGVGLYKCDVVPGETGLVFLFDTKYGKTDVFNIKDLESCKSEPYIRTESNVIGYREAVESVHESLVRMYGPEFGAGSVKSEAVAGMVWSMIAPYNRITDSIVKRAIDMIIAQLNEMKSIPPRHNR